MPSSKSCIILLTPFKILRAPMLKTRQYLWCLIWSREYIYILEIIDQLGSWGWRSKKNRYHKFPWVLEVTYSCLSLAYHKFLLDCVNAQSYPSIRNLFWMYTHVDMYIHTCECACYRNLNREYTKITQFCILRYGYALLLTEFAQFRSSNCLVMSEKNK